MAETERALGFGVVKGTVLIKAICQFQLEGCRGSRGLVEAIILVSR